MGKATAATARTVISHHQQAIIFDVIEVEIIQRFFVDFVDLGFTDC